MNQQYLRPSMTMSNILYDLYARSNSANYVSTITPKQDSVIDIIKNGIVIVPVDCTPTISLETAESVIRED